MSSVINICNLSKKYKIGHVERYKTLSEEISKKISFKKYSEANNQNEFLALDNVSFQINQGEVVGIIGRNGAGKSTLLKILSRITYPTIGTVELNGKVGSLLEVGTGFHPELTGRENIMLSGSLLGMKKKEIEEKYDEIVKFAEIEKFLDTPVKRYSSGMYVRLAFAVAANLEPDILLIDEVLAVGDTEFQNKCLGKMQNVANEGRTILFVSHNMAAVNKLCSRGILLEKGKMSFDGVIEAAIDKYLSKGKDGQEIPLSDRKREKHVTLDGAKIIGISVNSENIENPRYLDSLKPIRICLKIMASKNLKCSGQIIISDEMQALSILDSATQHNKYYELKEGYNEIECYINKLLLYSGNYKLQCALTIPNKEVIDQISDAYYFSISHFDPNNTGYDTRKTAYTGVYFIEHKWIDISSNNTGNN
jgi:lipopolysaccharide transport system ATP-binding protein